MSEELDELFELRRPSKPLVNETVNLKPTFSVNDIDKEDAYRFDEHAEKIAAERGQIVVYPKFNQLQIDIDSEEQLHEFWKRVDVLGLFFEPEESPLGQYSHTCRQVPSKTPGHFHIYLTFHARIFTEEERILWQSMLGSDPAREFLNFMRLTNGIENPSRLFEPDPEVERRKSRADMPPCKNCHRSAMDHVKVFGMPKEIDDYCMGVNGATRYEPLVNENGQDTQG